MYFIFENQLKQMTMTNKTLINELSKIKNINSLLIKNIKILGNKGKRIEYTISGEPKYNEFFNMTNIGIFETMKLQFNESL